MLYEGKPVGTPDASAFWRIVSEYKVTSMFTAPTALRAIRRDDSENSHLKRIGGQDGLRTLRALFLAGERSEPSIVSAYQELLDQYGAPGGSHVIDNWWSTESGSPMTGRALAPELALPPGSAQRPPPAGIKPGSAGKAMPGFDVRVVDDEGKEVPRGNMGNIVLGIPLAPSAFRTLWEDEERFYKGYLKRFDGRWIDTGDAGFIDEEGYVSIMSRNDDVLNVSAHRLSSSMSRSLSLLPCLRADIQFADTHYQQAHSSRLSHRTLWLQRAASSASLTRSRASSRWPSSRSRRTRTPRRPCRTPSWRKRSRILCASRSVASRPWAASSRARQ